MRVLLIDGLSAAITAITGSKPKGSRQHANYRTKHQQQFPLHKSIPSKQIKVSANITIIYMPTPYNSYKILCF
jgi:hypothetical protein